MKKIITLKAWQRPDNLALVLDALSRCWEIDQYERLIISLDVSPYANDNLKIVQQSNISKVIKTEIHGHKEQLGCAGNSRFLFIKAFEEKQADFMVHLEDDTVPAIDYLRFCNWAYANVLNDNIFAVCPFRRKKLSSWFPPWSNQADNMNNLDSQEDLQNTFLLKWFECCGGFGMTQTSWRKNIVNNGEMFGVNNITDYGRSEYCHGYNWVKEISCSWLGSWAWPFCKFFRPFDMPCLIPEVSRARNIGFDRSLHLITQAWHQDSMDNPIWTGNGSYNDKDLKINYIF